MLCDSTPSYVGPLVGWSVGPLFTFLAFLSFLSIWLLPIFSSDLLQHCSCPPAHDCSSCVSGLVIRLCCHFDFWVGVLSFILRRFHLHKAVTYISKTESLLHQYALIDHPWKKSNPSPLKKLPQLIQRKRISTIMPHLQLWQRRKLVHFIQKIKSKNKIWRRVGRRRRTSLGGFDGLCKWV